MTKVVHLRRAKFDFYIGRKWAEFSESVWGNPFHLGKDGDRLEVLLKFMVYWYAPEQKWLRDLAVVFLVDKRLGCWCHPDLCHGDIIAGYLNWKIGE